MSYFVLLMYEAEQCLQSVDERSIARGMRDEAFESLVRSEMKSSPLSKLAKSSVEAASRWRTR